MEMLVKIYKLSHAATVAQHKVSAPPGKDHTYHEATESPRGNESDRLSPSKLSVGVETLAHVTLSLRPLGLQHTPPLPSVLTLNDNRSLAEIGNDPWRKATPTTPHTSLSDWLRSF